MLELETPVVPALPGTELLRLLSAAQQLAGARGIPEWGWEPYHPGGTMQGKAMDASMQKNMSFVARYGHNCGGNFIAADFLKAGQS